MLIFSVFDVWVVTHTSHTHMFCVHLNGGIEYYAAVKMYTVVEKSDNLF